MVGATAAMDLMEDHTEVETKARMETTTTTPAVTITTTMEADMAARADTIQVC